MYKSGHRLGLNLCAVSTLMQQQLSNNSTPVHYLVFSPFFPGLVFWMIYV